MIKIDALGKPCPIPVIEAKKALNNPETDSVIILVDNLVSIQNLEKMANGYGYTFSHTMTSANEFTAVISKNELQDGVIPLINLQSNTETNTAVFISSNTMGKGEEELGKILIKGFIYSLSELLNPPEYLVFFNSGVKLTSKESNTIEDLKKITEKGTKVLACGTCVNYYNLGDEIAIGTIVNMYEITEIMTSCEKIINI